MTTTTFNRDREQLILGRGDPAQTPRRRAAAHGLTLPAYLAAVYGEAPTTPQAPDAARARRIIAALVAEPLRRGRVAAIARAEGVSDRIVWDILRGRAWRQLPRPWGGP